MLLAGAAMLTLWSLRVWSWRYDPYGTVQQLIFHNEMFMEFFAALAWLVASTVYVFTLARVAHRRDLRYEQAWLIVLALLCLTAFVEETSWGQHLVKFQTPESVARVNFQRETNLHNLNLAQLLHLSPRNPLHSYLLNVGDLLTPLFFLICFGAFAFLPLLLNLRYFSRFAALRRTVVTNVAVVFLFANLAAYFVVNQIANAYEVIEVALAFAVLASAIDTRRTLPLRNADAN